MDDSAARLLAFIAANAMLAGPVIGLLTLAESLVVIGLFVPATALMIAIGGLMGSGILAPAPVIAWAVLGAMAGDWISYGLGRRIGPSAYRRWPLRQHRPMVARARLFFRRFGFASIFLGRFLGLVRATVPLVAGVLRMDHRLFQLANVGSAILWVPLLFAPGYFAARTWGTDDMMDVRWLMGLGLALAVLPLVGGWLTSRIASRRRAQRRISSLQP
ncbi:DedA family protein [Sphingobium aromaticiconvertens]|uniref:DedA family protein n=1 Tax=Sphingobium aromaticiconvertens TaxID=365341 RepID=UPI003019097E